MFYIYLLSLNIDFGWESNKVVAVAGGSNFTLEMATRAKTELIVIFAESEYEAYKEFYADYQKHFQAAADKGLVELFTSENENETKDESGNESENRSAN